LLIGTSGSLFIMAGTFGPNNVPYRLGISTNATTTSFYTGVVNNLTNIESAKFEYTAVSHTFFTGTTAGNQSNPNQYTPLTLSNLGNVGIGTSTLGTATKFTIGASQTASSAIARGALLNTTLVAATNNDVLVGLDIAPTYTNGAFTGLTNVDLRTSGANVTIGSSYGYGALYGYANDGIVQIKTASVYKTQMWFRPSGNAGGYNANYWSRIEHDMGTLNIIGSAYGQLSIASSNGTGNGAKIYFSGSTGAANNGLALDGPGNSGRIALTTYGSSPITINGGNLLVNTIIDAGFKADINGTVRIVNALTLGGVVLSLSSQGGGIISSANSAGNNLGPWINLNGPAYFNPSTGNNGLLNLGGQYYVQSGNSNFNHLGLSPIINASGTYSGTIRGFYYNPTLTSITGVTHYAFHSTSGRIRFENLPTSPAGLSSGELYNNLGVLMIV